MVQYGVDPEGRLRKKTMATLKLKKSPEGSKPATSRHTPLRGKGLSRPRQTLEQAQAERRERQAAFEQRKAEQAPREEAGPRARPGAKPGPKSAAKPGFKSAGKPGARPAPRAEGPRSGGFRREDEGRTAAGEPRRKPARRDEPGEGYGYGQEPTREAPRRDQRRATGPRPDLGGRPGAPSGPGRPARQSQPYGPPSGKSPYPAPRPGATRARPSRDEDDDDEDFHDATAEGERLSKRMGTLGLASRREADEWIAAGWVRVDGKLAVLGQRVGPDAKIEVDPAAHKEQAKQVTILLHKPIGYVSGQAEDGYEPASVLVKSANHWKDDASGIKYHIGHSRSLAPAGRLDIDSTGLLVLTQDGRIAKQLIGDDSKIEKEYLVRVEYQGEGSPMSRFPAQDLALLNHGLELDGVQLKPAKVSWINDDQLRFVLREGRKRQIRRMCELVGLKVVGLKRVRIGRINLGHLPPGQWRFLSPWERFD